MSATRLLVLGVVRLHGAAHGYQVRRALRTWSADRWANAQPGSIYHALKKMASEGLLDIASTEPGSSGPDRTEYRLTEAGEVEYQVQMAHGLLGDPRTRNDDELLAALALLPTMHRQRATNLLTQRLNRLRAALLNLDEAQESSGGWGQPEHIVVMYRFWRAQHSATIAWGEDLVERLNAGELTMADDEDAPMQAGSATSTESGP